MSYLFFSSHIGFPIASIVLLKIEFSVMSSVNKCINSINFV